MKKVSYLKFKQDCCKNCVYNIHCNKNWDVDSYCEAHNKLDEDDMCECATILYGVKTKVMLEE